MFSPYNIKGKPKINIARFATDGFVFLFIFQMSFLSSQDPEHYITWITNHCTQQKHQRGESKIKRVIVATHLSVGRRNFAHRNVFQNGVNTFLKMVDHFLPNS